MTRLAIIPARGGSVRIPRKNIRPFHGRPIIEYAIQAAKESALFDHIIVSTDDAEIEAIAIAMHAFVMRRQPDDGTTGTQEVASRVVDQWACCQEACVIYPCSPMLTGPDLRRSWEVWQRYGHEFALSVLPDGSDAGCFYWGAASAYRDRLPLATTPKVRIRVPAERFIDINTPQDWARAESMFNALHP